jgi:hypothetical protein
MLPLLEQLTQLENLKLDDFIRELKSLSKADIKQSAKGLNFIIGKDSNGKLFTSKYSKDKPIYKTSGYEKNVDNNPFISAHTFVIKNKQLFHLQPNEYLNVKIIYFNHSYDKVNKLVIIKHPKDFKLIGINIKKLSKCNILDTIDGKSLNEIEVAQYWKLTNSESVDIQHELDSVNHQLDKLEHYLNSPSKFKKYTNYEIATINLIKVDKEDREDYKKERDLINNHIFLKFKLPIKKDLLEKYTSGLSIVKGKETIEIKNDETDAIKNKFFLSPKHKLSGIVRSTDITDDLESIGGLVGKSMQRISAIFGLPELANISSAKRIFLQYKGESPEDTADNFSKNIKINFYDVKSKIEAILKNLLKEIDKELEKFKTDVNDYSLTLPNGETIKFSDKEIKENLLAFADTTESIELLLEKVEHSKSLADLIMIIYEKALDKIHGIQIKENLHTTANVIKFAYTANFICGLLLLKVKDKTASHLLHDEKFYNLRKFGSHSPLNHWGYLLFNSLYNNDSESQLQKSTIKVLHKVAGRFIDKRIKSIHRELSRHNNFIQDWEHQAENMKLVLLRLETDESIKFTVDNILNWNELELEDKVDTINTLLFYLQRHDSTSKLLPSFKKLANDVLLHANVGTKKMTENLLLQLDLLSEDDGGATAGATTAGGDGAAPVSATTAASIASYPQRLFKGKVIVRKKRTYTKPKKFSQDLSQDLSELKQSLNYKSIIIEWNDPTYKNINYEGFNFVKQEYNLGIKVVEENKFPKVKLTGSQHNIDRFLTEQYGFNNVEEVE